MIQCPTCQYLEVAGAIFCSECGTQLLFPKEDGSTSTLVYPSGEKQGADAVNSGETPPFPLNTADTMISLRIVDSGELLPLPYANEVTIGRITEDQPIVPDVDLNRFSAYQSGVSRLHAAVRISGAGVQVIDLGSANGTRVNGMKIPSHVPYPVKHGDLLIFGKMKVQVLVRS